LKEVRKKSKVLIWVYKYFYEKYKNKDMKLNKIYLSAFVIAATAISSCSKDDEPTMSKTELLTSHGWIASKAEISYDGKTYDITSSWFEECSTDNTITFSKTGGYSEDSGTDTCNGDEFEATGTWSWKSNETILSLVIDGDTEDLTLMSIDSKNIKVNSGQMEFDTNGDGIDDETVDLLITLKAK
jgi:hypothetical protein